MLYVIANPRAVPIAVVSANNRYPSRVLLTSSLITIITANIVLFEFISCRK